MKVSALLENKEENRLDIKRAALHIQQTALDEYDDIETDISYGNKGAPNGPKLLELEVVWPQNNITVIFRFVEWYQRTRIHIRVEFPGVLHQYVASTYGMKEGRIVLYSDDGDGKLASGDESKEFPSFDEAVKGIFKQLEMLIDSNQCD
jgi:hypothetical protein